MRIQHSLAGIPVANMNILLTEDDCFHAEIALKTLQLLGFKHIDHAQNGAEGLILSKQKPYHLIISDCTMPEMNGYAFVEQLRKEENGLYADIPIMMLTSSRDQESVNRAKEVGVSHYIAKPFEITLLRDKIIEVFANKPTSIYDLHRKQNKNVA